LRNAFEQPPWRDIDLGLGTAAPEPPSPNRLAGLITDRPLNLTVTIDHDCHPPRRIVGAGGPAA
jgi:hypothetical protein